MILHSYFQSYKDYFWQWEEQLEILAIPKDATIAYRKYMENVLVKLSPQGLPPFGSLLLAIVATNAGGSESLNIIRHKLNHFFPYTDQEEYRKAFAFLALLAQVPQEYKEGDKRLLLLQAIFERCHNIISVKRSKDIRNSFLASQNGQALSTTALPQFICYQDFRTITLLQHRFKSVEDILNKIASLATLKEEVKIEKDETQAQERFSPDFVSELINEPKTFHIGALIKLIWSGLNIPVHSSLPSAQPLGGISDLTNKGDFDKLLISEFANDDLVFMSRLANNEALYIHREIPPTNNELERIILIDVSLKNWGTPKNLAYATMLAIAKHPKTDIPCRVFAIGEKVQAVSFDNIHQLIEALQILDAGLYAAEGLRTFFKTYPTGKNTEVFIITAAASLKQAAMLKAVNDLHAQVNYWIYTDNEGNIDVYKKQQNSKKHIQHILLPLAELWEKPKQEVFPSKAIVENHSSFPLLLANQANARKYLTTSDGAVFQITKDKYLLKRYDEDRAVHEKGWDFLQEKLALSNNILEIGLSSKGEYILLSYYPQNKEIRLLNIHQKTEKRFIFKEWKSGYKPEFVFENNYFYHRTHRAIWRIDLEGNIQKKDAVNAEIFTERAQLLTTIHNKHLTSHNVLSNITSVFINNKQNLVFNNKHELVLVDSNKQKYLLLNASLHHGKLAEAQKTATNIFTFPEGSSVEIHPLGMLILRSKEAQNPPLYIPMIIDFSLAIATDSIFAGNDYFYKDNKVDAQTLVFLEDVGVDKITVIKMIKVLTNSGLLEAKGKADDGGYLATVSESKAVAFKADLEALGAKVLLKRKETPALQTKIHLDVFIPKFLTPFIARIIEKHD